MKIKNSWVIIYGNVKHPIYKMEQMQGILYETENDRYFVSDYRNMEADYYEVDKKTAEKILSQMKERANKKMAY